MADFEMRNISKRFGNVHALENANFSANKGEACKLADYQAMKNGLQITAPMEHQLVLDAIKERNEDKAAFELKENLEYSARLLKGDFTPRKFGACKLRH